MNIELCLVLTTVANRDDAARLADALLTAHLAACVQCETIESRYWWQGELCCDDEVRLVIKTARHLYAAVEALLLAQHPYNCPQIVCVNVDAVGTAYRDWAAGVLSAAADIG